MPVPPEPDQRLAVQPEPRIRRPAGVNFPPERTQAPAPWPARHLHWEARAPLPEPGTRPFPSSRPRIPAAQRTADSRRKGCHGAVDRLALSLLPLRFRMLQSAPAPKLGSGEPVQQPPAGQTPPADASRSGHGPSRTFLPILLSSRAVRRALSGPARAEAEAVLQPRTPCRAPAESIPSPCFADPCGSGRNLSRQTGRSARRPRNQYKGRAGIYCAIRFQIRNSDSGLTRAVGVSSSTPVIRAVRSTWLVNA